MIPISKSTKERKGGGGCKLFKKGACFFQKEGIWYFMDFPITFSTIKLNLSYLVCVTRWVRNEVWLGGGKRAVGISTETMISPFYYPINNKMLWCMLHIDTCQQLTICHKIPYDLSKFYSKIISYLDVHLPGIRAHSIFISFNNFFTGFE